MVEAELYVRNAERFTTQKTRQQTINKGQWYKISSRPCQKELAFPKLQICVLPTICPEPLW